MVFSYMIILLNSMILKWRLDKRNEKIAEILDEFNEKEFCKEGLVRNEDDPLLLDILCPSVQGDTNRE